MSYELFRDGSNIIYTGPNVSAPRLRKAVARLICLLIALVAWPASAQTVTYVHTDALGSVVAKTDARQTHPDYEKRQDVDLP